MLSQVLFLSYEGSHPVLKADIAARQADREAHTQNGFTYLTDDASGGMVEIHDRRPICLGVEDALSWLDSELSVDQALQQLSTARPESAFQWWEVTRKMGNSRYQMPNASEPL